MSKLLSKANKKFNEHSLVIKTSAMQDNIVHNNDGNLNLEKVSNDRFIPEYEQGCCLVCCPRSNPTA